MAQTAPAQLESRLSPRFAALVRNYARSLLTTPAVVLGLCLVASSASGQLNPYPPAKAQVPPQPPGSAADPQEDTEQASPTAPEARPPLEASGPPLQPGKKRPTPRYHADTSKEEPSPWLWVPRVALSPLYFTSEYLVRRPLGAFATYAEKHRWPQKLVDALTWNDQHAGILPTIAIDWGFRANGGFYLFWNDLLLKNNDFRLNAETGGIDWNRGRLIDYWKPDPRQRLELKIYASARPDHLFWGIGPATPSEGLRFGATDVESSLADTVQLNDLVHLNAQVGWRRVRFRTDPRGYRSTSLETALATGQLSALPQGIHGYSVAYEQLAFVFDSRPVRKPDALPVTSDYMPKPGSGVRVRVQGRHDGELEQPRPGDALAREWMSYGGSVGGYVDLTGLQRVLGLIVSAEFADPLHEHWLIPFTELPTLGGGDPLRGSLPLRMLGRSTVAGVLNYRWPLWGDFDGNLDIGAGNAFGPELRGFAWDQLRLSADLGFRGSGVSDYPFEFLLGFGTRTFARGTTIEQFRVVAGTSTEIF